ncbi:DedA family protein [bacterium]|nr:DedA family protein [bacterium]
MHDILVNLNNWFQSMGPLGLAINSCIESFFLLPPPDFLLIAMDLANPNKALLYALICTLASAIGGSIGYAIGFWGGRPAFRFLFKKHMSKLDSVEKMYKEYGSFAVFFSAFTPVPYKIFTIGSGILRMNFWKFFSVSLLGRGSRFFLVSLVLMFFGETVKKYLELVILAVTILIIVFCVIVYKKGKKKLRSEKSSNGSD